MGSKRAWPAELAERFRAVGWEVSIGKSGHWKARRPDGQIMSWGNTPGSSHGRANSFAQARRFGLDAAEEKLALRRERDRLQRIEDDRQSGGVASEPAEEKEMQSPDLGTIEVDGRTVAVAEIVEPAMYRPLEGAPWRMEGSRELLLEDTTVRLQCVRPTGAFRDGKAELCLRHFPTANGLNVHQGRMHGKPRRPAPAAEPPQGALAPAAPAAPQQEEAPTSAPEPGTMARAVDLARRLRGLAGTMDDVADSCNQLLQELEGIIEELPGQIATEELREKAARFDRVLRGLTE